ncbi:SDR family NAD(P)-dependent oxidoreductase [Nonomuraea rubra]
MTGFPEFRADGKIALVTGAARGLGRAISLALANAGADLALGLRDVAADGGLSGEIERMGRAALPLQMDMTVPGQISAAVQRTLDRFGRIDILVNNAGIAPGNPAEDVTGGGLRPHPPGEPEGHLPGQPGGRPGDDRAGPRHHRERRLAGG